jgi:hypothetical protein
MDKRSTVECCMLIVIQIRMPEALSLDIKPVLRLKETSKSIKEGSEGGHEEVTEGTSDKNHENEDEPETAGSHQEHKCQSKEMLNCLTFYLDGGMYTFLYPLDARHPNPPQSPLGSGILIG